MLPCNGHVWSERVRLAVQQLSIVIFYYKILYTNMEGLRELRGMAVFPAEETTRGYFCYLLLFN